MPHAAARRRTFATPRGRSLAFTLARLRRRAARQHAPHSRRMTRPMATVGCRLGRGAALLRHRAALRPRALRAADRPRAGGATARRVPPLDQGRPAARALRAGRRRRRHLHGRPAAEGGVRLHPRRRDALVRGEPGAARPGPGRHPLCPRPGAAHARLGSGLRGALARADRRAAAGGRWTSCAAPATSRRSGSGSTRRRPASGSWPRSIPTSSCSPAATPCWSRRRCTGLMPALRAAAGWAW